MTRALLACCVFVLLTGGASAGAGPQRGVSQQRVVPQLTRPMVAPTAFALPAGARIEYDPHNCVDNKYPCPNGENPVYVRPSTKETYHFVWNVAPVPNAGAISWQVLYTPFVPATFATNPSPQGVVVKSGVQAGQENEFEVDLRALAETLHMTPVVPPSTHMLHLPPRKAPPSSSPAVVARGGMVASGAATLPTSHL